MRKQLVASMGSLLVSASCALAQAPVPAAATPPPPLVPAAGPPAACCAGAPSCDIPCGCCPCGDPPVRFWANAEYLLWRVEDSPAGFPLLTSGTTASQGVIGVNGTNILIGGSPYQLDTFNGIRFTTGVQDPSGANGVEAGAFLLERRSTGSGFANGPFAVPVLARPIINANTGLSFSTGAHFGGNVPVTNFVSTVSSRLWGAEANLTSTWFANNTANVRLLGGFRYLDLDETLGDATIITAIAPFDIFTPGTVVDSLENFHTRNQFYGGQFGIEGGWRTGPFFVEMQAKLALGITHEVVSLGATQTQTFPTGNAVTQVDSVLIRTSNVGRSKSDMFALLPEVGVNLGYEVTEGLRVYVGYSFMYLTNVARPGDQINPVVNLNNGVPPFAPTPVFHHTEFWAQGVNFGMALRY